MRSVFHSDEMETGLDISEESGTSIFIESVLGKDKIVGWIKTILITRVS